MRRRATSLACTGLVAALVACSAGPPAPEPACPARLDGGQRCTATVQADQWQNRTGLQVRRGEAYCVQAPAGQAWFDMGRPNTPPHGEPGNWLMQRFNGLKRHADSDWFSLMAAVDPADPASPPTHQDLGRAPLFRATQAGALVLYANDAVSPVIDPLLFYRNNSGRIQVTVQRCETGCDCPVAPPR